jgi:hypothetical protein
LYSNGAKVTLVQRSSTQIVNVEPSAQLPYALYDEGPSLEDCDLITTSIPLSVAKRSHILLTQQAKRLDKDLLDGLERKGFRLDFGEDGTGWQFKYLTRGGGYYFNVLEHRSICRRRSANAERRDDPCRPNCFGDRLQRLGAFGQQIVWQ